VEKPNFNHVLGCIEIQGASDQEKATFIAGAIASGMRETKCESCGCLLLTRGTIDVCPPCRMEEQDRFMKMWYTLGNCFHGGGMS
jgi:hypothetical protein